MAKAGFTTTWLGKAVHHFIGEMCKSMQSDTQEIEGFNNTIKHIKEIASNISYLLLNSRSINKKTLASNEKYTKRKDCVEQCDGHHKEAIDALTAAQVGSASRSLPA